MNRTVPTQKPYTLPEGYGHYSLGNNNQYGIGTAGEIIEPRQDYVSIRNTNYNSPQQYMNNSNLYSRGGNESEPTLTTHNFVETSSPIKVQDQSVSSISKNQSFQADYKSIGPVRTQTYSPVNNPNLVSKSPSKKESTFEPGYLFYESPGQKKINLTNSSKMVLKKVFDTEYSVDSPSKKKLFEKQESELYQTFKFTESTQDVTSQMPSATLISQEINFEFLQRSQQLFLNKLKANPKTEKAAIEDIVSESIDYLKHLNQHLRVGAILNIFEILFNQRYNIGPGTLGQITSALFNMLPQYHASNDFYMLYFTMETLILIGPNSVTYNNIKSLLAVVSDDRFPKVQEVAIKVLVNLDYPGLNALIDLANKDFNDLPLYILNQLAQCPEIQARVIVPSLLNDFNSNDVKKKYASLAALNRMFAMTKFGGGLAILINLLQEGNLDKQLIISTILACGPSGEAAILKILKTTKDAKLKQAICSVLPWRNDKYNRSKVRINIIPYQVSQHYQYNPGTMCVYQGNLKPLSLIEIAEGPVEEIEDAIEINSRDFMASLQRLLTIKYQEFALRDQEGVNENEELKNFNNYNELILTNYFVPQNTQFDQAIISPNIIKALMSLATDSNAGVREAAVNALGVIGPPEASDAVDVLVKSLYDSESQIRATAAWALGKLGDISGNKATKRLIELLKDNFWKVRTSACIALGYMGENVEPSPYQILVKILKDGSINRVVVCETLVRLGVQGEQILLDILKQVPNSNYALKSAIIQSLELADVDRPTIDFVIEELFRNSADQMVQVRKSCLITLEKLRSKSHTNNITYLKSRNILPLFYFFLQDPANEIRDMALQSIYSFGPQGELMLIEGLAKDKNPVIRAECAKGLGLFGPHTFRALIFGMRDQEESVRTATANALKKNFTPEDVINVFKDKHHQKPAIVCSIREILGLNYYFSKPTKEYLESILKYFQNEMTASKSQSENIGSTDKIEGSYQSDLENRSLQYSQQKDPNFEKELSKRVYQREFDENINSYNMGFRSYDREPIPQ